MSTNLNTYTPYFCYLTNISNSQKAVATFGTNHSFLPGEIVSFRVSKPYGMTQMNNVETLIMTTTPTTITVNVDTTFFEPFIYPPSGVVQSPAMVVPSASGITNINTSSSLASPAGMNLADAFDNMPTY